MTRKGWDPKWVKLEMGWVIPACICERIRGLLLSKGFYLVDDMLPDEIMVLCDGNIFVAIKANDYDMDGKACVQIIVEDEDSDPALVAMLSALA